jgi:hypothetical protein
MSLTRHPWLRHALGFYKDQARVSHFQHLQFVATPTPICLDFASPAPVTPSIGTQADSWSTNAIDR